MFCLKNSLKNNVPFSNNYMNNKNEEFKKSLGIKSASDETQIRIDDEDECIYFDVKLIEQWYDVSLSKILFKKTLKKLKHQYLYKKLTISLISCIFNIIYIIL